MSAPLGLIGGTGFADWSALDEARTETIETEYGRPSSEPLLGRIGAQPVAFISRHGAGHAIPPHAVNYRANIAALAALGCRSVVGIAAVGGIAAQLGPGRLCVPDDVIDYTWGREHTYSLTDLDALHHVELSVPYDPDLRQILLDAARAADVVVEAGGVLGVTQGPRLETPAEVRRLQRDGCSMVGMTGMPEASLARERGLDYACLAMSVNWAAGLGDGAIHAEIDATIAACVTQVRRVLDALGRPSAGRRA